LRPAVSSVGFVVQVASAKHTQLRRDVSNLLRDVRTLKADAAKAATGGTAGVLSALPLDKIIELVQKQGYSNITGLAPSPSGNTLQAAATNSSGSPVNLLINPTSGGVISALGR